MNLKHTCDRAISVQTSLGYANATCILDRMDLKPELHSIAQQFKQIIEHLAKKPATKNIEKTEGQLAVLFQMLGLDQRRNADAACLSEDRPSGGECCKCYIEADDGKTDSRVVDPCETTQKVLTDTFTLDNMNPSADPDVASVPEVAEPVGGATGDVNCTGSCTSINQGATDNELTHHSDGATCRETKDCKTEGATPNGGLQTDCAQGDFDERICLSVVCDGPGAPSGADISKRKHSSTSGAKPKIPVNSASQSQPAASDLRLSSDQKRLTPERESSPSSEMLTCGGTGANPADLRHADRCHSLQNTHTSPSRTRHYSSPERCHSAPVRFTHQITLDTSSSERHRSTSPPRLQSLGCVRHPVPVRTRTAYKSTSMYSLQYAGNSSHGDGLLPPSGTTERKFQFTNPRFPDKPQVGTGVHVSTGVPRSEAAPRTRTASKVPGLAQSSMLQGQGKYLQSSGYQMALKNRSNTILLPQGGSTRTHVTSLAPLEDAGVGPTTDKSTNHVTEKSQTEHAQVRNKDRIQSRHKATLTEPTSNDIALTLTLPPPLREPDVPASPRIEAVKQSYQSHSNDTEPVQREGASNNSTISSPPDGADETSIPAVIDPNEEDISTEGSAADTQSGAGAVYDKARSRSKSSRSKSRSPGPQSSHTDPQSSGTNQERPVLRARRNRRKKNGNRAAANHPQDGTITSHNSVTSTRNSTATTATTTERTREGGGSSNRPPSPQTCDTAHPGSASASGPAAAAADDSNKLYQMELLKRFGLDLDEPDEDNVNLDELRQENTRLKRARLCQVCKDQEANRLFLPCAHLASCALCSPALTHCPQCKAAIRGIVSVYFG